MREVYMTPEEWAEQSAHAVPEGPPIPTYPGGEPMYDYAVMHQGRWARVRIVTPGMIKMGLVPGRRVP